jgi:hypothetical protein
VSVINTLHDYHRNDTGQCSLCDSPLRYPFLHWDSIEICGQCCRQIKNGFIADLIQIVATMDIVSLGGRDYSGYYSNVRLVRKSRRDLEANGEKERQDYLKELSD